MALALTPGPTIIRQCPGCKQGLLAAAWLAQVEAYNPAACQILLAACNDPTEEVRSLSQSAIEMLPEEIKATPPPAGKPDLR